MVASCVMAGGLFARAGYLYRGWWQFLSVRTCKFVVLTRGPCLSVCELHTYIQVHSVVDYLRFVSCNNEMNGLLSVFVLSPRHIGNTKDSIAHHACMDVFGWQNLLNNLLEKTEASYTEREKKQW